MKKTAVILLLTFMTNIMFAQTDNYKNAIDNFQKNFNSEKYEDIFNSFSSEMKQALPFDQTKQFLTGLKSQVGKMEKKEFVDYQQGTYATYKTNFEKSVLAVNISLDSQNKINGLFIKPYEKSKKTESDAVNSINSYPTEIAEIIFAKAKNFPNETQLSIAVIQNGKTNYYGIIKVNDTIKPTINQNKVFEIGSITKVFTSTVLASLVEDNKLKLTDEINTFYSFPFKKNFKISFKSLANHTSGLPKLPENFKQTDVKNPYKDYDKKEIEDYLKNVMKLDNGPLTFFSYSNLGAGLLGYTLGLSQKTSFQQLLQKRIFDKYKMTSSFTTSQNLGNQLVKGLDENGEVVSNWDFDVLFGGGGILSTTEDLVKFANTQFNQNNTELALTRKPTFDINNDMKIGLGWHILKTKRGFDWIWHNGGTGGYSSSMVLDVEKKNGIIILSNLSAFNPKMENIDKLCFELMKQIEKQ
jgi:CubicO group peptidase (beta-lactamase class C family)